MYQIIGDISGNAGSEQWYVGLEIEFTSTPDNAPSTVQRTYIFTEPILTKYIQLAYATDDRPEAILFWAWTTDRHLLVPIILKGRVNNVCELTVPEQEIKHINVAVHGVKMGRFELQMIGRK